MSWSPRAGTRAAAHLPSNADELCKHAFFCLVYCMEWEDIPPKLVINVDQPDIFLLPNSSQTHHTKGDRQVDLVAKDEKRAYTLLVASTSSGDFLPFQCVWPGKTHRSLPSTHAPEINEAVGYGFHFTVAASEKNECSHFSTLKMMKEWMWEILHPYVKCIIDEDPTLDQDQKSVVYNYVYPVHQKNKSFHLFVFEEFSNIVIIFVPANCTGMY
ncbi:hypothetical protein C8R42DRAFT_697290 [Lentinula raphanica]|nr:hypothetical protein C8R42DRAFT_697290 [Lentinula raphanica]